MPQSSIEIVDWGKPGAPIIVNVDDKPTSLEMHVISNSILDRLADYAGRRHGTRKFHLGFYGYLRVCDAVCTERTGVSIMDLADADWRNFYDEQLSPHEAVTQQLKENGYQI
jgi:hypothetical protein